MSNLTHIPAEEIIKKINTFLVEEFEVDESKITPGAN